MKRWLFFSLLCLMLTAHAQPGPGWHTLRREPDTTDRNYQAAGQVRLPLPTYLALPDQPPAFTRTRTLETVTIPLWGEQIRIQAEALPGLRLQQLSPRSVTQAWQDLRRHRCPQLLHALREQGSLRRLNDWGFLQWVHSSSQQLYPGNHAAQQLLTAWLMQQSGYNTAVSVNESEVYLLVQTEQRLYGHAFLPGQQRWYVVNPLGEAPELRRAYLVEATMRNEGKALDLRIAEPPRLSGPTRNRAISFRYERQSYQVSVPVHRYRSEFYHRYPLIDWQHYLQTPLAGEVMAALRSQLLPIMRDLPVRRGWTPEMEQANFLLHFVQNGLPYRSDTDALGKEHYAFPEETLALRYSDCEDRAALYILLVRELLGLEAVGLLFPTHAAAGVDFGPDVHGDAVNTRGTRFLICDPSYLGADIGMLLPAYLDQRLTLVGR